MPVFKVAALSKDNKTFTNAKGDRFFVPVAMRDTIKIGDACVITTKTYEARTNEQGVREDCDPWQRQEVAFIGTLKDALIADNEEKFAQLEMIGIMAEKKKELATTYGIEAPELTALSF